MVTDGRSSKSRAHRRPVRPGKNAPRSEKVQASLLRAVFNRTFAIASLITIALTLATVGAFLWFNRVYSDPERVFWDMVDNSLATRSVTKKLTQENPAGSSVEYTQLVWNPNSRVKTLRQLSYNTTSPPTKLTLESINTPSASYQRYSHIDRGPRSDGTNPDYSNIYKLWLKDDSATQSGSSRTFNDAVFNIVLFGNLAQPKRQEVVDMLRDAYQVDFSASQRHSQDGRRTRTYEVTLNLRRYAEAAKRYAEILGLPNARSISPGNYRPEASLRANFTIDVLSRQLRQISYSQAQSIETYSGYGIAADTSLPTSTVSPEAFQKALDATSE